MMNVTTLREYQMQESQIHTTLQMVRRFAFGFQRGRDELQLQVRMNMLDDTLRQFYVVRRKIAVLSNIASVASNQDEEEQLDQHNEALRKFEDDYCEVKGILQNLMPQSIAGESSGKVAPGAASSATCRVKLPEIKLPAFSGKLESWITFRDTFRSLIHNNQNLQTIDKFTYLRASLTGEALQEIGAVEITGANYEVAWNLLEKRYENKRLILKTHLDAIYAVEAMRKESFESLNYVLSAFEKNLQMVDKLGVKSADWSILLAHTLMSKLDSTTLRHWETHYNSREFVKYEVLVEFLRDHCAVLRSIAPVSKASPAERERPQVKYASSHAVSVDSRNCCFCDGPSHNVFQCNVVRKMSAAERHAAAKKHRLCYNCLGAGHSVDKCTRGFCTTCKRKHHTLLHDWFVSAAKQTANVAAAVSSASARPRQANKQQTQPQLPQGQNTSAQITQQNTLTPAQDTQQPTTANTSTCNHSSSTASCQADCSREVLLSTAVVRIRDAHGHMLFARALLDSGSQRNLMTKEFAQKLNCKLVPDYLKVKGVGAAESTSTTAVVATVCPRLSVISEFSEPMRFHVLAKVTSNLPFNRIDVEHLGIPEELKLADPQFFRPGPIDLLIGAEFYYDLLTEGRMKLGDSRPTIQSTVFGWIVSGVVDGETATLPRVVTNVSEADAENAQQLLDLLAKFWELESCQMQSAHSLEESECERIFKETTVRDSDGRFVVTLPKKEPLMQKLGESRYIALRQYYSLERRLAANPELRQLYKDFLDEYLQMGHMVEVHEDSEPARAYYLPHHAVVKPDSTTTKLRVVFNGSSATSTGVSLNDALMVGPVVQDNLQTIILRFRLHAFVFVADVAKMYRMVNVAQDDQDLQRILWRDSPNEPVRTFKLTMVTYGTASAPYLATKCLQTIGEEAVAICPKVAETIKRDFYVDDMLSGAASIAEARELALETSKTLEKAGFILRKWRSSNDAVLEGIPSHLRDDGGVKELDTSSATVKTLGLRWDSSKDEFTFSVPKWNSAEVFTKQTVLSDTARIFDPIGLVGPVVVTAKIFLQELWKIGLDWKDPLPSDLQDAWMEFRRNMLSFDTIQVPRWVGFAPTCVAVELHGFCDASEKAYGACIYVRSTWDNGFVSTRLLTSKSKVAPLDDLKKRKKKQSIPRLELSSALLLCHLLEKEKGIFPADVKVHCWTDSMIVRCWLASAPSTLQPFVANRTSEIQHVGKDFSFHHVPGVENPADLISRGVTAAQLAYSSLWWNGPAWLRLDPENWPKAGDISEEATLAARQEQKASVVGAVQVAQPDPIFTQCSSLFTLVRAVARVQRLFHNAQHANKDCKRTGYFTFAEHETALMTLVKRAQRECFAEELGSLEKTGSVKSTSRINSLNPKLVDGVMLVGGRLRNATMTAGRRHPIILDHRHPFTLLIIRHYHYQYYHAGLQLLIACVRERFWPLNVRRVARQVIHRCVACFRHKPKVQDQLMADLPELRVNPAPAFIKVGVDYCGPFQMTYPGRKARPVKCFVAVFVCLVTKAIHLEVVSDLTTQAFLAALKRFTGRRGCPQVVMCDNAKTFVGARREIDDLAALFKSQAFQQGVVDGASVERVEFKFIPARSPNFGGLWEAAVKSFKTHLKKTVGLRVLNYDEWVTVLIQIEACLNSRPLTPLSSDPNDLDVLTPGHFLIQRPLVAIPEPNLYEIPENRLSAWQKAQNFVQQMWKKWSTQYLSDLHNRTRWTRQRDNIRVGTMVLLKEENLPPLKWALGRVVRVIHGNDGNVRVAVVKTKESVYERGISKICVLPISDNDNQPTSEDEN